MKTALFAMAWVGIAAATATADEPGWTGRVLKVGERAEINAVPIEQRPYRPLHFYGNTVRRLHYRGQALPSPTDLTSGIRALVRER